MKIYHAFMISIALTAAPAYAYFSKKAVIEDTTNIATIATEVSANTLSFFGSKPEKKRQIIFIIDNAGTSPSVDPKETSSTIRDILRQATRIRDRDHDVFLDIILTTQPTDTIFSGSPKEWSKSASRINTKLSPKNTCSDLKLSVEQALVEYKLARPDRLDVVFVSPMIHIPFPCGVGEGSDILLPQPISPNLGLQELAQAATTIKHYFVDGDQKVPLLSFYEANKSLIEPNPPEDSTLGVNLEIYGVESTRSMITGKKRLFN